MTEPTDAEIESAWTEATGSSILPYPDDMLAFARAVLAKWGTQPVPAGYALVPVEPTPEMLSEIWVHKNGSLSEAYRAMLAAAPRPTQAQAGAVPLTDEQVEALILTKHFRKGYELKSSDRTCLAWYLLGLRDGERAHGITGGRA